MSQFSPDTQFLCLQIVANPITSSVCSWNEFFMILCLCDSKNSLSNFVKGIDLSPFK